jgi:hypothetical protein
MVAGLLYVVGLIATLATIGMVGYGAPALLQSFNAAVGAPNADMVGAVLDTLRALNWAVAPFVGGLVLMGLGRIVMLLRSIDRALRGSA